MALSACKDDALVQGFDGDDVLANTVGDQIFKGRLGNDVYSYLMSGTDTITDTGGSNELRVSVVHAEAVSVQKSFKRVGDDLVVTQSGEGNSVTVVGAFVGSTALEQVTLVYEDCNDQITDLNIDEDTLTLVGFGYESEEDIIANVTETLDGSVLFSDQGTEIELSGVSLDEALNMDLVLSAAMETGDDLGTLTGSQNTSWCCTASLKRNEMEIRHVKAFRRWHVKKSRLWQEGYHIWGRIVADKWLMRSQWAAKETQDLFNLIMHKELTFRGLLAWLVIPPPAMLIGSYIVLAQKLDRVLGRTGVRGITG